MGLVDYSDDSDDSEAEEQQEPAAKKQRVSDDATPTTVAGLPPLPSNFRDLYSSTVRTSTHDDPELHAGRKRVTPHVVGNWPAHVYLEWTPESNQQRLLSDLISSLQDQVSPGKKDDIHSLLENDLGVQLPLHISLSRPLALKTANKDTFLANLTTAITATSVRAITAVPDTLIWHPNEDRTRWFLVLSLERPESDQLRSLLGVCNKLAGEYGQPLLYQTSKRKGKEGEVDDGKFHVSLAWSLTEQNGEVKVGKGMHERLKKLPMEFDEVKVRIGQDVTGIPLRKRRGLFGKQ